MKTPRFLVAIAAASAVSAALLVAPVIAHHASAPFYDPETRVEIEGPVSRFVFRNPHAFLYLDGPGDDGQTVEMQMTITVIIILTMDHVADDNDDGEKLLMILRTRMRVMLMLIMIIMT